MQCKLLSMAWYPYLHESHQVLDTLEIHIVVHTGLWHARRCCRNDGPITVDGTSVRFALGSMIMDVPSSSRISRWIGVGC